MAPHGGLFVLLIPGAITPVLGYLLAIIAAVLVDQGDSDNFYPQQLQPEALEAVAQQQGFDFTLRWQKGYDHSYFFIASVVEDHLRFHGQYLLA